MSLDLPGKSVLTVTLGEKWEQLKAAKPGNQHQPCLTSRGVWTMLLNTGGNSWGFPVQSQKLDFSGPCESLPAQVIILWISTVIFWCAFSGWEQ